MIKLNGFEVIPTRFPDKTTQVWNVNPEWMGAFNLITWDFDNEGELLHVAQLKDLLETMQPNCQVSLELTYLPYGRQDKDISNDSTFALTSFAKIINGMLFSSVQIIDPHSKKALDLIKRSVAIDPTEKINHLMELTKSLPCFPDAGAMGRYHKLAGSELRGAVCDKVRDQASGKIVSFSITGEVEPTRYLIIDDICDGGWTFTLAAKALYDAGATEVNLYVTHGIFSKGLQVLRDAGIKRIFTYKGEVNE